MTRRHLPIRIVAAASVLAACLSFDLVGLNAQSGAYNPAIEGKLWKQLLPWGLNTGPNNEVIWADRRDLNNIPGSDPDSRIDTGEVNVYFDPIYQSLGPYGSPSFSSLAAAEIDFARLVNEGECTFSHEADYDIHWSIYWPQVRICKGPQTVDKFGQTGFARLPPGPGRLLNPVGLATSGKKVFVTDLFNHRVQAFDFYGNFLPMKYPIGNGTPGSAAYDYDDLYPDLNYRPFAAYPGFENDGFSGHQLSSPAGIAVDARVVSGIESPRLLIADSENYRLALFNDDGSPAFLNGSTPVHLTLPVPLNGANQPILTGADPTTGLPYQFKPDLVAISAGAVIRDPLLQQPLAPSDPDYNKRIVVADRVHCFLAIMDVGFNLVKTLPPALPNLVQHDACQDGGEFNENTPLPGEFRTITGVKVDANGTIYVADTAASAIRVFDRNGNPIASIGEPGGTNPGAQGDLRDPVGVFIDEKFNRLGVIDQGHGRAVFYDLTNGPASVTFEFQIETTVAVDDFPMGVIMQYGDPQDGLDPKGRIMVTDPYRRRVLRWELPELVIANATAEITNYTVNPKMGVGSFDVVVPYQKLSPVFDVVVDVQPQVPCPNGNSHANCVRVDRNSITPSLTSRPDITNGTLVHYTFQFTSTLDEAKFDITAIGCAINNCGTPTVRAPDVAAIARALCDTCVANHEIFYDGTEDPALLVPTPPTVTDPEGHEITGWYNRPVYVRITPDNSGVVTVDDPNEIVAIGWSYGGVSNINYEPGLTEVAVPNGEFLDVPVGITGISWVTYRPITRGGAAGAPVVVVLPVDMAPPVMTFNAWPAPSGVNGTLHWYRGPVSGSYQIQDPHSGPRVPASGTIVSFTQEGRDQFVPITLEDRVDNATQVRSDDLSRGGKPINIDTQPPSFGPDPITFTLQATNTDGLGDYVDIAANRFMVAVTDPLLADGSPGSGAVSPGVGNREALRVRNGGTIYFDAIDHAGNASVGVATIEVTERAPVSTTVSVVGGIHTYDGYPHPASCVVNAGDGTTFPGTLYYSPVDGDPVNAGTVTAHCEFSGNGIYVGATPATATVVINKVQPLVTATGGVFDYDGQPHASTCSISGVVGTAPVLEPTYNGTSTAPQNATPSPVAVRCEYAGDANHEPAFATNSITINKLRPVVTATGGTFNYDGQPHGSTCSISGVVGTAPVLAATYNGTSTVPQNATPSPVAVRCEYVGDANHEPAFATNSITINKLRPVVTATGGTFMYDALPHGSTCGITGVLGSAPVLEPTYNGVAAAVPVNVTLSPVAVLCAYAGDANHEAAQATNAIIITPRPITIQTTSRTILETDPIPSFPYVIAPGSLGLVGGDIMTGTLGGVPTVAVPGVYPLNLGNVTAGSNYTITLVPATLTIQALNAPPVAVPDVRTSLAGAPVTINVVSNDSDPDGTQSALKVVAFTQPGAAGVVTQADDHFLVFTPAPGFAGGVVTFTYTIEDPQGAQATTTVTITVTALPACSTAGYTTYSQGGWGNTNGTPGRLMQDYFAQVYPLGYVIVGGTHTLKFIGAQAITDFLPQGGTPAKLTESAVNPTSSTAGNFAAQVLALRLAVDYSAAGVLKAGLGQLVMVSGPFAGQTVLQVLATANAVLGGAALPSGMSVSQLNSIVESLNLNFHEGTVNNGLLRCPTANGTSNGAPNANNDSVTATKNTIRTINVLGNDTDPDGDDLAVTAVSSLSSSKGKLTVNSDGTIKYEPKRNYTGTFTFTYTISDGRGGTDTAKVTVQVKSSHTSSDGCDDH